MGLAEEGGPWVGRGHGSTELQLQKGPINKTAEGGEASLTSMNLGHSHKLEGPTFWAPEEACSVLSPLRDIAGQPSEARL